MDWWGLPDAVATAGKLFEYQLDHLLTDHGDDDDDYGSATADTHQPPPPLDVYQVLPLLSGITNTKANSAFHPSGVGKSSTASLSSWDKVGRICLCRVEANTL